MKKHILPVILGIVSLVLLGPLGLVIFIVIWRKKAKPEKSQASDRKSKYNIIDYYNLFECVLNSTLGFIKSYKAEHGDETVFLNVSYLEEESEYSTASLRVYDEYVEMRVFVGLWYDGIMNNRKKEKEYMENIYTYDESERTFTYKMRVGESQYLPIPLDVAKRNLNTCIDRFEKEHPEIKLDRTHYGIHQTW